MLLLWEAEAVSCWDEATKLLASSAAEGVEAKPSPYVGRSAHPSSHSQYPGKDLLFQGKGWKQKPSDLGRDSERNSLGPNAAAINEKQRFPSPGGRQQPVRTRAPVPVVQLICFSGHRAGSNRVEGGLERA